MSTQDHAPVSLTRYLIEAQRAGRIDADLFLGSRNEVATVERCHAIADGKA